MGHRFSQLPELHAGSVLWLQNCLYRISLWHFQFLKNKTHLTDSRQNPEESLAVISNVAKAGCSHFLSIIWWPSMCPLNKAKYKGIISCYQINRNKWINGQLLTSSPYAESLQLQINKKSSVLILSLSVGGRILLMLIVSPIISIFTVSKQSPNYGYELWCYSNFSINPLIFGFNGEKIEYWHYFCIVIPAKYSFSSLLMH